MINFDGIIVGSIVHSAGGRRYVYLYNIYIEAPSSPLFLPIQLAYMVARVYES